MASLASEKWPKRRGFRTRRCTTSFTSWLPSVRSSASRSDEASASSASRVPSGAGAGSCVDSPRCRRSCPPERTVAVRRPRCLGERVDPRTLASEQWSRGTIGPGAKALTDPGRSQAAGLFRHLGVDPKRCVGVGLTEAHLGGLHVDAFRDEHRRRGVSQIVERELRQPAAVRAGSQTRRRQFE